VPSFRTHGRTYLTVLFVFITGIQAFISDNHVTPQESVQIAFAFFTAVAVYLVPNIGASWVKTAVSAILAALAVLTTAIIGGVSTGDVTNIVLAVLTALGVAVTPSQSVPDTPTSAGPGVIDAEPVP
jgi:hypothetical protein